MRKILKAACIVVCCVVWAVYFVCCLSAFISPVKFSFISILAIAFPYFFIAAIVCCALFFFIYRRTAALLAFVIILAGFKNLGNTFAFNAGGWNMAKENNALRVMTWNVQDFISMAPKSNPAARPRMAMLAAINTYHPDVLCLQEYRSIESSVRTSVKMELGSLGYSYSICSNDYIRRFTNPQNIPVTLYKGVAIFSKTPFADSGSFNIGGTLTTENAVYADVKFGVQTVRVFTAHLLSFVLYPDTSGAGDENIYKITYQHKNSVQQKLEEVEKVHANQAAIIRDVIDKSPYPVMYCGDINSPPTSYTYNKLKGNLQDAFLQKGFGTGASFYKLLYTLRIDVCLAGSQLKIEQCTTPKLRLSDHYPVVTDVSWK